MVVVGRVCWFGGGGGLIWGADDENGDDFVRVASAIGFGVLYDLRLSDTIPQS